MIRINLSESPGRELEEARIEAAIPGGALPGVGDGGLAPVIGGLARWRRDAAGELHYFERGRLWSDCRLICRSLTTAAGSGDDASPVCPLCRLAHPPQTESHR